LVSSDLTSPHVSSSGCLPSSADELTVPIQLDPPKQASPPLVSAHKQREIWLRSGPPGFSSSANRRRSENSLRTVCAPRPFSPSRMHIFPHMLVDGVVKPCGRRPKLLLGLIPTQYV
jgi:hypothetical protein